MLDLEKVIKAIDICLGHGKCNDCPYCLSGKGYTTIDCHDYMLRDAIVLLKAQRETIEGTIEETRGEWPDETLSISRNKEREYPCDHSRRNKA